MPDDRDKQIDHLYSAPLNEFVERRNELVRSLRKDGDRGAADEVKGLRKPTLPAWTVNQLARREKMRLRGLLTAGERLRKAHQELLSGGSPEALQQGRDGERRAIAELTGAAEALLEEAGHPTSEATLERVSETLHAAVVDESLGRRVREGRLDKEEQATGFGFGTLPAAPGVKPARATRGQKRRTTQAQPAQDKRAEERKARELEAAQAKHRQAEESLRAVRRAVKDAERAVKSQARELERAERVLSSRRAEVADAERRVAEARRSLVRT